jgi:zinc transport system ATP-binding protein
MKEPDILFLDEATAGVDAIGEKDFYEFLEWIHKEKHISIVLVSHNIHTVFSYSNRVICLDKTI